MAKNEMILRVAREIADHAERGRIEQDRLLPVHAISPGVLQYWSNVLEREAK